MLPKFYDCIVLECLKFSIGTAIVCLITFLLDVAYCKTTNNVSLLGFQYRKKNTLFLFFWWCFGGFLISSLIFFGKLMQSNAQSIIILGICWPVAWSKIVKQKTEDNLDKEVADEDNTEEGVI